ncbi:TauD/TfdA family dioxygenase [Noviherbaspirillum sp. ST9]|uniref:TauD/TfdA family dioxygenase n=1 Tax=Noviherbaspirillum sp. ST9 TaxID=3401606 RepID=UPI003B586E7F
MLFEKCMLDESGYVPINVRNRKFLAGSRSTCFPVSIPSAEGMVNAMRLVAPEREETEIAHACREMIDSHLPARGAILLRGLPLETTRDFNHFLELLDYPPFGYEGGIAVRNRTDKLVYEASQEHADITMTPHNEMAYLKRFPRKIFFFCEAAAPDGGEVPINDVRLTAQMLKPELLSEFRAKGIRYTRRLHEGNSSAEIGWRQTFQVEDRGTLEAILLRAGYEFAWGRNGDLRYSYCNPAFVRHPDTGEELWFNQVTELHGSYWQEHPLFEQLNLELADCPANTTYGDGTPIPTEVIEHIRGAIWQTSRGVRMQVGDVLVLDNVTVQHGRMSYHGFRRHAVSLTD